ncbi:hypothetical protein PCS93_04550 [Escherichia coli]|nr:hypothetical protein PCS93_04550 [Escherichia coli]
MSSGVLGSLFCLFILYASQIEYVALIPILLTCGLPVFIWSRKKKMMVSRYLPKKELIYLIMLLLCDIIVVALFIGGYLKV